MTTRTTGWVPPTETERLLYEARAAGDEAAGIGVLSRAKLFLPTGRLYADTPGATAPFTPVKDPENGKWSVHVRTAGMLQPWHPDWVHLSVTLAELARVWPNASWRLAVNSGTPCAISLKAKPSHRQAWLKAGNESGGPPRGLLVAYAGGPSHGALAHGLACGAHLSLHNSVAWNELGTTYFDYRRDAASLREVWRVTNRAQYADKLEELYGARLCGWEEAIALNSRAALHEHLGRAPSEAEWQDALAKAPALHRADAETVAEVRWTAGRIARYEERFRADGILTAGERVDSLRAFDYGRIISFVRMGLGARLTEPGPAEEAVLAAGRLSRETYNSWEAFSAAYALARVLAFDDGEFGRTYQESVAQHRILTQDLKSPYRSLPWS
ncbi:DUF1266 domain-containing protein [Streptomyces sp. NPDC020681]|uniref:DUF1266 domain-containing protein n=1 Tax=Streptomyces sp. NPDC020681 TaxID=3365083 RepID=UPI0037A7C91F